MSNNHSGTGMQNEITREEHDGVNYAKRVNVVAGSLSGGQATVSQVGLVTLAPSPNFIGLATVKIGTNVNTNIGLVTIDGGRVGITGNLTLSNPNTYIGLTTTTLGLGDRYIGLVTATNVGLQTLAPSPNFIGIVTVANPSSFTGNITLDAGSKTQIVGNITLSDPKGFIGLVTIVGSLSPAAGNITLDPGSRTGIVGNVTLSDSKGFIGLTTTTLGASPAFIGLVTVIQSSTTRSLIGNVTLSDPKTYIGLTTTTLGVGDRFIGLVTVVQSSSARSITGNLTITDSKGFIGLVTSVPAYGSNSTVFTGVISATGNTTVLVAPASNRFFIKNLHISSLGRSEVEIRSGATTLIPFTSLSTTAGYFEHYGEQGLPARAQTDALVFNLNGGATISYMANVRFEA